MLKEYAPVAPTCTVDHCEGADAGDNRGEWEHVQVCYMESLHVHARRDVALGIAYDVTRWTSVHSAWKA